MGRLSPFNKEKTPSFHVHPQKGFFNCFSSGEKGDGITFIQKLENLDFYEAVEYLSREFNIPLRFQEGASPTQSHGQSVRKGLFAIQEMAKDWFQEQFNRSGSEYEIAKKYWVETRCFNDSDAKAFEIGYAPADRFALGRFLSQNGHSDQLLSKSGLFYERKTNRDWVSIFCGRLMIPIVKTWANLWLYRKKAICDSRMGRKKRQNTLTRETPIFLKGQLLQSTFG